MSSENRFGPVVVRLAAAVLLAVLAGEGATQAPRAAPPQQPAWQELQRWHDKAEKYISEGKLDAAVAAVEKILAVERKMFGAVHEEVAGSLSWLGELHERREDFDAAVRVRQEALRLQTTLDGKAHWRTVDARLALANAEWLKKATPAKRAAVRKARTANARAVQLWRQGKAREGLKPAREALEARRAVLGEKHPDLAASLDTLAALSKSMGDPKSALGLYTKALEVRRAALGERHPIYAVSLNNLAALYHSQGDYKRALPLLMKARDVRKEALGEKHPTYAVSLDNLAALYTSMGDAKNARALAAKAAELRKQAAGGGRVLPSPTEPTLLVQQRDVLWQRAEKAWTDGKQAEAVSALQQALAIERRVFGPLDKAVLKTATQLADWQTERKQWREAAESAAEALKAAERLYGPTDWRTVDARWKWRTARTTAELTAERQEALQRSRRDNKQRSRLFREGQFAKALILARTVRDTFKSVLGEKHPDYATSLDRLAAVYAGIGDHKASLPLYRQALNLRKEVLGERHPRYANSLYHLAGLYQVMGDPKAALPLTKRALAIAKDTLGEKHQDYASSLNGLAILYEDMGDYKAALPLYKQSLAIRKEALGEKSTQDALSPDSEVLGEKRTQYAMSLSNLAGLYSRMGDPKAALPLCKQALAIVKDVLGEKHPAYAGNLDNLAGIYKEMGDAKAALLHCKQALAIYKEVPGEKSIDYALTLDNLAGIYKDMGDAKAALPLCKQALAVVKDALGEKHPTYAGILNNLATLCMEMGDHEAALPLCKQALAVQNEILGTQHPDCAASLGQLALLYHRLKKESEALRSSEQGLAITFAHLRESASVQSERQQLAAAQYVRQQLDQRLSLADSADDAASAYRHVLASKGAVLFQQQQRRLFIRLLAEGRPEVRRQVEDLQQANRSLAALALAPVDPRTAAAHREQMEKLTHEKEELEIALAKQAAEFRQARQATPADVAAALPEGVALIDFLFFTHHDHPRAASEKGYRSWLTAFVLRRGKPVVRVDLGEAEGIESDISEWRRSVMRGGTGGEAGKRLRQRLWEPTAKHTEGAKVVLLSLDGRLGELPFAALPGSKAGTYLVEEVATVEMPVPSALPVRVVRATPRGLAGRLAASLLVVGDLHYSPDDKAPPPARAGEGDHSAARTGRLDFLPLEATAAEVRSVKASFGELFRGGSVTVLRGGEATKAKVRQALGSSRYAHLATHGFFNSQGEHSAMEGGAMFGHGGVSGWHPLLLSGLALSGANREPGPGEEDGILTALEVSEMELSRLELAVLSACETGRGKRVQGEGVLGLQRAFQAAGCRTVMASLWSVPDRATQQLMDEFYAAAWDTKKIISRAEALRQAQVRMLKEGVRGMAPKDAKKDEAKDGRLPPLYWAGFVLSGDWR